MIEFLHQKLSSGLNVIMEYNPDCASCATGYFVKAGSRNETPNINGISHFLEHMSFKGTKNRTAIDVNFDMGKLGAKANAFTSEEFTVYYGAILGENLIAFLDILTDMQKPLFDKKEFDLEKQVVLEEIARYKDRPQFDLFDIAYQDFFKGHPIGISVLGTTESVSGIEVEDMRAYHDSLYAANNEVLAIAGNFNKNEVLRFLETLDERLNPQKEISHPKKDFIPMKKAKILKKENLFQVHELFLINGVSIYNDDRYELSVLANIIGDSIGSKLYWELVHTGICDGVYADSEERLDGGIFAFYASTTSENKEKVRDVLLKHINSLMDFSEEDLERAKTKMISKITFSAETPLSRLTSLGIYYHFFKEQHLPHVINQRIRKITKEDIARVVSKLDLKNIGEYILLNK